MAVQIVLTYDVTNLWVRSGPARGAWWPLRRRDGSSWAAEPHGLNLDNSFCHSSSKDCASAKRAQSEREGEGQDKQKECNAIHDTDETP